jgi:hypothetical protein
MKHLTTLSPQSAGALIGVAATLLMLFSGRVAGIRCIFASCLTAAAAARTRVRPALPGLSSPF